MSRENLRNSWYCPVCSARLSYGIYCLTCKVECSVAWRWAEPLNRDRLERELKALIGRAWETDPPDFSP